MDSGEIKARRPNPREGTNFLSAITFLYAVPTFVRGLKSELNDSDLVDVLKEARSSQLGGNLERAWHNQTARKSNVTPSLWKAIVRVFLCDILLVILLIAASEGAWIAQPILCGRFLRFFLPGQDEITKDIAYAYGAGIILCSVLNATISHHYMMTGYHLGMKIRTACCSLIYRKMLKLSKSALDKTHGGQIINLLSNDMDKLIMIFVEPLYLFIIPLQCLACAVMMYPEMGISSIVGILILLAFVPIQSILGYIISRHRRITASRTDERVRLVNEVVSGIQIIKMFTWERFFADSISEARRTEMNSIGSKFQMKGLVESFFMFNTRIAIFGTILTYVLLGYTIKPEKMFIVYAFYNVLRPATVHFPESVAVIAEAKVSIKRITNFLLLEEFCDIKNEIRVKEMSTFSSSRNKKDHPTIKLTNVYAKWSQISETNVLKNINIETTKNKFLTVLGPVGSGKSTLLQVILKELPPSSGSIEVNGKLSYASQEPWLFAGTVRQNILFGLPMDENRYKKVIKVCALQRDMTLLPKADLTVVGDRGFSLSGGQRARINLARCVYKDADIYLLDDPLSAVDANVGKQIFEDCISDYLRDKIVIFTTNQLQYVKDAKHIIYLEDGVVRADGSYQDLLKLDVNFKEMVKGCISDHVDNLQSTDASLGAQTNDKETGSEGKEEKPQESVNVKVYANYFKASGSICLVIFVFALFILAQLIASFSDYIIAFWANEAQDDEDSSTSTNLNGKSNHISQLNSTSFNDTFIKVVPEKRGGYTGSFIGFTGYLSRDTIVIIYSGLCSSLIILSFVRSGVFYYMMKRISIRLHNDMFNSILRATMRFFFINDAGKILNRFSNDMGTVDEQVPSMMMKSVQVLLASLGIMITIVSVNVWFLIHTTFLIALVLYLRGLYLRVSRTIMRLERVNRSPVYGHVSATLQGLTTVRAFGTEEILIKELDSLQDLHSSAWYTFLITARAFGYWLDIFCVVYTASIIFTYLITENESFVGNVGLAITQAISLSRIFQWGVRQSTEMENQMTSVERVLEYRSIEHETNPKKPQEIPDKWPEHGRLEFRKVYLRYSPNEPPVLNNLSFVIYPREKIGIVGRTGAGKSSVINAIFQLAKTEGSIIIDDIDVTKINLSDLRSKVSIIPQQPVLFSTTLRKNLDPHGRFNDNDIWRALDEVDLREYISSLKQALETPVSEGGSNFSVGQKQLICLARAILNKNKILILDEATANVDQQTDNFIQQTIRKKFADCTVLTIAHRINTVIDSDRILVMDAGRLIEFDHPFLLLQNTAGCFYEMASKAGNASELFKSADKSYNSKP